MQEKNDSLQDKTEKEMRWSFVYEEEFYDVNGYCCAGILTNGRDYLFFAVSSDAPGAIETCRIYSSITFCPESLECQYPWTEINDNLLLESLNAIKESEPYYGEDSPIRRVKFNPSEA